MGGVTYSGDTTAAADWLTCEDCGRATNSTTNNLCSRCYAETKVVRGCSFGPATATATLTDEQLLIRQERDEWRRRAEMAEAQLRAYDSQNFERFKRDMESGRGIASLRKSDDGHWVDPLDLLGDDA